MSKWRLSSSSNTLLTSDKGQPLNKRQNGQKIMGPKRVTVIAPTHADLSILIASYI